MVFRPVDGCAHKRFFRSRINHNQDGTACAYVEHQVVMTQKLQDIKGSMFVHLKMNEIYLNSSHLDRVETTMVAWLHKAHPIMTFKPTMAASPN